MPATRSSGSWSCSAAAPMHARARFARPERRGVPGAEAAEGRRLLNPEDLRAAARHVREGVRRKKPLFSLAIYYPLAYYKGDDKSIDPFEENRQKQVVGLIRTNSSSGSRAPSGRSSCPVTGCWRKLLAFVEVHSETEAEKKRLERWKTPERRGARLCGTAPARALGRGRRRDGGRGHRPAGASRGGRAASSRDEYEVVEMIQETFLDLDQIVQFPRRDQEVRAKHDDKLKKLIRLLKSKELAGQKVLIFTEFADTARYLRRQLTRPGSTGRAARQRQQGESRRRHPALLALLQRHQSQPSSQRRARQRSAS